MGLLENHLLAHVQPHDFCDSAGVLVCGFGIFQCLGTIQKISSSECDLLRVDRSGGSFDFGLDCVEKWFPGLVTYRITDILNLFIQGWTGGICDGTGKYVWAFICRSTTWLRLGGTAT